MVAGLLADPFRQPHAILQVLLALIAKLVPIGPGFFLLSWFSVPVSIPEKLKLTCFPLSVKGASNFSGVILACWSFKSYKASQKSKYQEEI